MNNAYQNSTNILGFKYYKDFFENDDINEIKSVLRGADIQLIDIDQTGTYYNNIEEITNTVSFMIHSAFIYSIIEGILPNATWDAVKYVITMIFNRIKGKSYSLISGEKIKQKKITFGIDIKLNETEEYNFKFNNISSEKSMYKALDKILDFANEQKKINAQEEYTKYIVIYNENEHNWQRISTEEFIQKYIIEKQRS